MQRLIFYIIDFIHKGGGEWGKEVSRPDPQHALQYYPCQILTLEGWFMSSVSYTLYIYTVYIEFKLLHFPFVLQDSIKNEEQTCDGNSEKEISSENNNNSCQESDTAT